LKRILILVIMATVVLGAGLCFAQTPKQTDTFVPEYVASVPAVQQETPGAFFATLLKFAFSLVVVIVLVYATLFVLKLFTAKYKPRNQTEIGMCQLLDTLVLEPQKKIYLIGVDNKRVSMVASFEKELKLIDTISDPQQAGEIIAKVKEKWDRTQTFHEHLKVAAKKNNVHGKLSKQINDLTHFIRNLKERS